MRFKTPIILFFLSTATISAQVLKLDKTDIYKAATIPNELLTKQANVDPLNGLDNSWRLQNPKVASIGGIGSTLKDNIARQQRHFDRIVTALHDSRRPSNGRV